MTKQEELARNIEIETDDIRIICTTVHKAKGLEYGTVILPYMGSDIGSMKKAELDVYVEDDVHTVYDIEMQPTMKSNLPKRSRYYQGMIDLNLIERGADYKELKKSFVIFICTFDPFGKSLSHYTLKTCCIQDSEVDIKDGAIKEIFNAKAFASERDVEISNFLKYIDSKETADDFTIKINHLVEKAKINEKFRSKYLAVNIRETDIYEEGRNDGFAQGAEQKAIETAKNMLLKLIPANVIAECTGLPLETIKKLVATQK